MQYLSPFKNIDISQNSAYLSIKSLNLTVIYNLYKKYSIIKYHMLCGRLNKDVQNWFIWNDILKLSRADAYIDYKCNDDDIESIHYINTNRQYIEYKKNLIRDTLKLYVGNDIALTLLNSSEVISSINTTTKSIDIIDNCINDNVELINILANIKNECILNELVDIDKRIFAMMIKDLIDSYIAPISPDRIDKNSIDVFFNDNVSIYIYILPLMIDNVLSNTISFGKDPNYYSLISSSELGSQFKYIYRSFSRSQFYKLGRNILLNMLRYYANYTYLETISDREFEKLYYNSDNRLFRGLRVTDLNFVFQRLKKTDSLCAHNPSLSFYADVDGKRKQILVQNFINDSYIKINDNETPFTLYDYMTLYNSSYISPLTDTENLYFNHTYNKAIHDSIMHVGYIIDNIKYYFHIDLDHMGRQFSMSIFFAKILTSLLYQYIIDHYGCTKIMSNANYYCKLDSIYIILDNGIIDDNDNITFMISLELVRRQSLYDKVIKNCDILYKWDKQTNKVDYQICDNSLKDNLAPSEYQILQSVIDHKKQLIENAFKYKISSEMNYMDEELKGYINRAPKIYFNGNIEEFMIELDYLYYQGFFDNKDHLNRIDYDQISVNNMPMLCNIDKLDSIISSYDLIKWNLSYIVTYDSIEL